ncbi:hypothetical protein LRD18_12745 [Halorhodospira halochloris]|uniref:hypothetical protein n=1 Tax=Halorhodospira halochloris TaxID=1052 RepID=UPI001EE87701|nr:hypothetical protein [Halorhodospira halochloris]MCG5531705.1 hypothetical protein [Halorhodospira halochloris]MCG5549092.1 hypothetical protein [Halorhodospira halochloris]
MRNALLPDEASEQVADHPRIGEEHLVGVVVFLGHRQPRRGDVLMDFLAADTQASGAAAIGDIVAGAIVTWRRVAADEELACAAPAGGESLEERPDLFRRQVYDQLGLDSQALRPGSRPG